MSDPVTNMEIEDVLSSIRRLVAEGDKAKQEKKREYGDVDDAPDKFLLTPALRISEESSPESTLDDAPMLLQDPLVLEEAAETSEEAKLQADSDALKDVFVGAPHLVPNTPDATEQELNDAAETDAGVDDLTAQLEEIEQSVTADELTVDNALADDDDHLGSDDVVEIESRLDAVEPANPSDVRESLEATIAALEAAVTGTSYEFEPDGSEVEVAKTWEDVGVAEFDSRRNSDSAEVATLDLGSNEAVRNNETTDAEVGDVTVETPEMQVETEEVDVAEDVIEAEISVAAEETETPAENDHVSAEEVSETRGRIFRVVPSVEPEETVEDVAPDEPAAAEDDTAEEDYGDDLIGGDAVALAADEDLEGILSDGSFLDDAVLKKIVGEVVKGELEGKLGETITRNVRKLVRREIHRVLTHQELE